LIRRAIRNINTLGTKGTCIAQIAQPVFKIYNDYDIFKNQKKILEELKKEEEKFLKTLEEGIKYFEKVSKNKNQISGKDAFLLYQSFGFPIEMTLELSKEKNVSVDIKGFEQENKKHQELSRTASAGQFKSGLADNTDATKKLHTATHMLNEALKEVLGDEKIAQKGSNITPERLRFDFNFPRKLADEELKKVEDLVNKKISEKLEVKKQEMPLAEALKSGAHGEFGAKYPEKVFVFTILDPKDKRGYFSKEICTGPHASNLSELGKFKITKEESSAAGIRRIKAELR
jgi:alanyl-tRNA synthetase